MNWMKTLFGLVALTFSLSANSQGSATNATITSLYINASYSMVFIGVNVTKTSNPACSIGGFAFVLPLTASSTVDNQMLALLIAARSSQTPVTLTGTGTCTVYSDVETLQTESF